MAKRMRIEFLSEGFRDVLLSPGTDAVCAAQARAKAQELEREYGVPYEVERMAGATSRVVYNVKPSRDEESEMVPDLDHETWMEVVHPRVGGPEWRPH